jgi:transcriptional regulator with XRE-family HTH domain
MSKLRENLKREMTRLGWNAYQLSDKSGVPQPTIHRLISGYNNDMRTVNVQKLARALGVTEAELRGLTDMQSPAPWSTILQPIKRQDSRAAHDYMIAIIDLCDQLISAGLYKSDENSRRNLYYEAVDAAAKYNSPPIDIMEAILRQLLIKNQLVEKNGL